MCESCGCGLHEEPNYAGYWNNDGEDLTDKQQLALLKTQGLAKCPHCGRKIAEHYFDDGHANYREWYCTVCKKIYSWCDK